MVRYQRRAYKGKRESSGLRIDFNFSNILKKERENNNLKEEYILGETTVQGYCLFLLNVG